MATNVSSTEVQTRVSELRARKDADAAKKGAWQWMLDLRDKAKADNSAAEAELNEIFRLGLPPMGLEGSTDGILITTTTNGLVDQAARLVTSHWMPWQGKRFNAEQGTGDNRMTSEAGLQTKLLWPLYKMKDVATGKLAFDFNTYIEPGKADPDVQVMVIDYKDIDENPTVIRRIRDELVEVVPGTYIGKILFHLPGDRYELVGYFALHV